MICVTQISKRKKEQDCFNEIQITQNSLVASEALKGDGMTTQNLEETSEQPDGLFCAKPGRVSKQFTNSQV